MELAHEPFRDLVDAAPDPVLIYQDAKVVYANRAALDYLGYDDPGELLGCDAKEMIARHSPPELVERLTRLAQGETPPPNAAQDLMLIRRDRTVRIAERTGKPISWLGQPAYVTFLRDITDRERAAAALRRSEENFRTLIERAPIAISVRIGQRVAYANEAFFAYLGYSAQDLVGRSVEAVIDDMVHPDDRPRLHATLTQALREGRTPSDTPPEVRVRHSDGTHRVVELSTVDLEYDGERAVVVYLQDLTERRATEARLLLSDRMASLGRLAAGVAHEINNPLAYVTANVDFVARALAGATHDDGDAAAALSEARYGLERVRKIVKDLKALSRIDEEQPPAADLTSVLERCISMAGNEIRHRARVAREYAEVPPVAGGDSRLVQVFLNLLLNAAQAFEDARPENVIQVTLARDGERVRVEVRDNGVGVAEDDIARIFDPFFTTKPAGVGTGLGLSICSGIVRGLGGEIRVSSALGKGTLVTVLLPPATGQAAAAATVAAASSTLRRGRVLVIDDEPLLLEAVRRLLEHDHDVTTLGTAGEALDRLDAEARFDVILCDVMMPVMGGLELIDALERSRPGDAASVVLLTGGAFAPETQARLTRCRNQCLEKPFDAGALEALVRQRVSGRA